MTASPSLAQMTGEFLDRIMPTCKDGFLIVAIGSGPTLDSNGKYAHNDWKEHPVPWPHKRDAGIDLIQDRAPTCDVYICPYLMEEPRRRKGTGYRTLLHCDVDGGLDRAKVAALDGFVIGSGTQGHGHVYAPLEWPVTAAQHEILERGMVTYLGGDLGKISDNDLLRPPGTFNHKLSVNGAGMTFVMPMP